MNFNHFRTTVVIVLSFCISSIKAQDLLIMKDGSDLQVKVLEVLVDEIKYKKFSNLDGPIYSMEKDFVFMIKYENGTKDVFGIKQEQQAKAPAAIDSDNIELQSRFRKLRGGGIAGTVIGSVGLAISVPFLAANIIDFPLTRNAVGIVIPGLTTVISSVSLGLGIESLVKANQIQDRIRLNGHATLNFRPTRLTSTSYVGSTVKFSTAMGLSMVLSF